MVDLTYRDIGPNDFDDLHVLASQWSVVRQLGRWPWPAEPDFTRSRSKPYEGKGFVWAVCHADRLIGTMAVARGELGYMFSPDWQGKGIATRAARHALDFAFKTYDWPMLRASVWHDNYASASVLRKCGFVHWQSNYERSTARRLPTLVHQYRLPRHVWDRLRTIAQ